MKKIKAISTLVALLLMGCARDSKIELPAIIADGMILQQNSQMAIWGRALPGSRINLRTDWDFTNTTTTKPDSTWKIDFPTIKADNKTHKLVISASDTTIVIDDILLGEVWLAAGQDNMAMPLQGWGVDSVIGGSQAIAEATDDMIRFFNVDKHISWNEDNVLKGHWAKSTPENARLFSAIGYFFAQNLRDSLNVPIAIINATLNNSTCEAWTSDKQLINSTYFGHRVANLPQRAQEMDEYINWLNTMPKIILPHNDDIDNRLASVKTNDEFITMSSPNCDHWADMELPKYWDNKDLGDFDGVVWFVKQITIPHHWIGKQLELHLGNIDDCDMTYVNGICIGSHNQSGQYDVQRVYNIPSKFVQSPNLTIAIKVTDTNGQGGFGGTTTEEGMRIQVAHNDYISLEGRWKYRPVGEFYEDYLALFDPLGDVFAERPRPSSFMTQQSPAALFYGMIYPISNYAIKGVIWAQGEGNVRHSTAYEETMPLLINSFRETFKNPNLPFYFTQLTPYGYVSESANLREAQRRTAQNVDNCKMISTLDIGVCDQMRPPYKKEISDRLARVALHNLYGYKHITESGPILIDVSFKGQFVTLTFENADGLYNDPRKASQFEIAGENKEFFTATPIIQNNEINLYSHAVNFPRYVRYAYRNCSTATLFNSDGLPAESFFLIDKLEN